MAQYEEEDLLVTLDFYEEHPDVANFAKEEVDRIRMEKDNIMVNTVKEENYGLVHESEAERKINIPNPITKFEHAFRNYPEILAQLEAQGFENPSPIQCQAWPILLKGMDLIGIAQTGTGKTLAFLLPALIHIDGQTLRPRERRVGPTCLVLAPTRELAIQIDGEVKKINYKGIKSICIYGGVPRNDQINDLRRNRYEIIIATPGRLLDFIEEKIIDLSDTSYVVLDEADKMLDLGFNNQIRFCLLPTRLKKQVVMTTATWSFDAQLLGRCYYKNAIKVDIGSLDLTASHSVTQRFVYLEEENKEPWIFDYLKNLPKSDKAIVFMNHKARVDHMASDLVLKGIDCESIHGGRSQNDRESALRYFRNNTVNLLISTDLAARGIDITDITIIINYDLPNNIEEYVHRIGRTGRAGRSGESLTLLTYRDSKWADELIKIIEEAGQEVPDELHQLSARHQAFLQRPRGRGGRGRRHHRGHHSSSRGYHY